MIRSVLSLAACFVLAGHAMAGDFQPPTNNIPEPGIVALIAIGAGGVLLARRKK